jgi:hypothetical protein
LSPSDYREWHIGHAQKWFFLANFFFVDDVFFGLVEKTMFTYVHHALADCISTTSTFDLWMSKGAHDVFIVVVNFLSSKCKAKHIIIGLFIVSNTSGATMAPRLQQLLDKFFLTQKMFAYVKDEVLIYRLVQVL